MLLIPINKFLPMAWAIFLGAGMLSLRPMPVEAQSGAALDEYPRPQMLRGHWQNLNGLWDYAITTHDALVPGKFDGLIVVPFAVESALSGVKKSLLPENILWYRKRFSAPVRKKEEKVLLHFGAVDQAAWVYINGKEAGRHSGGFDAFTMDITGLLKKDGNEIVVKVTDPTDRGDLPHGKQTLQPMWTRYTAVSGIWQTVWIEIVPADYIEKLKITPDIDRGVVNLTVNTAGNEVDATCRAVVQGCGGCEVLKQAQDGNVYSVTIKIPNATLWSPENPSLYDLVVRLTKKGKVIDEVKSYFGMRKIAVQKDENGIERIFLNNQPYFSYGTLDQGYWPDGLYTAPDDAALAYDIETAKQMGFNTIRKHVKIEPERWYYLCDKIGMLVWQDMPSWRQQRALPDTEKVNFESESKRHVTALYNHPSIIMWCIFNEDWGAYDQRRLADTFRTLDKSRILNTNSGSFKENWEGSDVTDRHMYPDPTLPPYQDGKAMLCGEFGGVFLATPGHEWSAGKGWGHSSPPGISFEDRYRQMVEHLKILKKEGLSGAIFTQPYDVETEENGLYTYDRKVLKISIDSIRSINVELLKSK